MFVVEGLALVLAFAGFLAAATVEHRFQSFLPQSQEISLTPPVPAPVAAE